MKQNLKQKLLNLKNKVKKVKFKYFNKYKSILTKFRLFRDYVFETTYSDYKKKQVELEDKKTMFTVFKEYMIDNVLKYMWIGFILNLMIIRWVPLSIIDMVSLAITYWLLTKLLLMIFVQKKVR